MAEEIKTQKITEFMSGQNVFASHGVSKVKVTKEGKIICLEIPIKSTGISELIDTYKEKAPIPPIKNELVTPDSAIGKEMKLVEKKWMKIPDLNCPEYLRAKEEHDSNLGIAILMKGIAVPIKNEKGEEVTDSQEKIKILKSMEMSGDHFGQIITDITSLTKWSEQERESFLE